MGREILSGKLTLAQLSERVLSLGLDPKPTSGRQEMLENLLSQYL
jgi:xylose isomerase